MGIKDRSVSPIFLIARLAIAWLTVALFFSFGSGWFGDLRSPARVRALSVAFRHHSVVCIRSRRHYGLASAARCFAAAAMIFSISSGSRVSLRLSSS